MNDDVRRWVRGRIAEGKLAHEIRPHALAWGLPAAECDALLAGAPPVGVAPPQPVPPAPARGPGTELKALLAELGLGAIPGCRCEETAADMDRLGATGCRGRRDWIAKQLTVAAGNTGFVKAAAAAARAVVSGLAFRLDLTDLYGSLVDEAIRRAAAKETNPP